jgi:hypothetical protein
MKTKKILMFCLLMIMLISSVNAYNGWEYNFIIIEADYLNTTAYTINSCVVEQISDGIWRIDNTNPNNETKRALIYKTLFYGTDGTNARITNYTINVSHIRTNFKRDVGKKGYLAILNGASTSGTGDDDAIGTFTDTTNNLAFSSWSRLYSSGADIDTFWKVPSTTVLNQQIDGGTKDEIGLNLVADEKNNPATCKLEYKTETTSSRTGSVKALMLLKGNITWVTTINGEGSFKSIDFYEDFNIPLLEDLEKNNITFHSKDIFNNYLTNFNITLSNSSTYSTLTNESIILIDNINNYNITFSKTNFYNMTLTNLNFTNNTEVSFEDVYDSILNITQYLMPYNTSLNNFSGYVYEITNDYNVSFNTTTNQESVGLMQGYNYTVYLNEKTSYSSFEEDIYINTTTYNLIAEIYKLSSIFITFFDELLQTILNTTTISLDVITEGSSGNYSTTNGTIYLTELIPSEYILRYSAENYTTRERIVTVTSDNYFDLNLFLISNTSTDHQDITFNVRDFTDNNIENADVKALKYDITTGNYIFIDSCRTNFLGQCMMNLEFGTEYYKLQVEYELETMLTTSPTYITSTSYVLRIDVGEDYTSDYFNFMDIDASLVYNNATNNFRLTYNDNNDLASNFCVYVYSFRYLEKNLEASSCSQTSSGTVLVPITPLNGTYYVAYAYYDDPAIFLISASYEVPMSESFSTQGIFLQILLTIVFAVASLKFIEFTGLSVSLSLILGKLINLNTLGWEAIIGILVASIVIIFVLRRDK